jgi:hypothetical protein
MKSPTQSVRYRVRRAGATPSGRARSIGRGWEDCQGSGCFSTDPAKAYKYGSDEGCILVDFGLQPWRDVSTPEISRRSRLAGEGAVSPDIYVSDQPRSPASRLLQMWCRMRNWAMTPTHCRSALARERDLSAPSPLPDTPRSPASRLLQMWCRMRNWAMTQTHCRSALARERDPSAPSPLPDTPRSPASRLLETWCRTRNWAMTQTTVGARLPANAICQRHRHRLIHRVRQQAGSYRYVFASLMAALTARC